MVDLSHPFEMVSKNKLVFLVDMPPRLWPPAMKGTKKKIVDFLLFFNLCLTCTQTRGDNTEKWFQNFFFIFIDFLIGMSPKKSSFLTPSLRGNFHKLQFWFFNWCLPSARRAASRVWPGGAGGRDLLPDQLQPGVDRILSLLLPEVPRLSVPVGDSWSQWWTRVHWRWIKRQRHK